MHPHTCAHSLSWAWTNYWSSNIDTPRVFYHCATIWKPLHVDKVGLIKMREGAALLTRRRPGDPSASERENLQGDPDYQHERLRQLEHLYEPQVINASTRVNLYKHTHSLVSVDTPTAPLLPLPHAHNARTHTPDSQVLCIVTKLSYHESFQNILRTFVEPIYR